MKIRTLDHVNSHWSDGRHLSAGQGAELVADDADTDAVAHLQHLVATGQAEVVDEPEPDPEAELDDLREQAEAAGVKVDRRWGADRLREEITKATDE
jgi:hypothetical protein